jgi:CheY-like chemotaxis protein
LINQAILKKQLTKAGCIVYVANHGLEALETLRRANIWEESAGAGHKLDVVLMDLEMPVMDGLSASREIRSLEKAGKLTKHVEIIAITANVRKGQVDRALAAGINAIMAKPFLVSDLLETIKTRLGR